ncbi:YbjN domain-containing protein [Endozoicomonadaceae bacterium StTr2]
MNELVVPDMASLEAWVKQAGYGSWQCDQCNGLHIDALQELEGVVDSRLFLEPFGIIFSTELDIRNSTVLAVAADLGRLNMTFPTMKLFLDVVDDGTPLFVMSQSLLTAQGVTYSQFANYLESALYAKQQIIAECKELHYLFNGDESNEAGDVAALRRENQLLH